MFDLPNSVRQIKSNSCQHNPTVAYWPNQWIDRVNQPIVTNVKYCKRHTSTTFSHDEASSYPYHQQASDDQ